MQYRVIKPEQFNLTNNYLKEVSYMKKQLYRAAAATVLGLSLATGGVAAASPTYQNYHHNNHNNKGNKTTTLNLSANVSNVGVENSTDQSANTGDAIVSGGLNSYHHRSSSSSDNSAKTGGASNTNTTNGTVTVGQSAPKMDTAPSSTGNDNKGGNTTTTVNASLNYSNVEIDNTTTQSAQSGNATVTGNNKGGSAQTGDASNTNTSTFTVGVTQ